MTIQRIGVGARMSKAVVHGSTIYLAGQVADQTIGKSCKLNHILCHDAFNWASAQNNRSSINLILFA